METPRDSVWNASWYFQATWAKTYENSMEYSWSISRMKYSMEFRGA